MKTFKQFNNNKKDIEIAHYSLKDAIEYSKAQFEHYGNNLYDVIPDFDKHYEFAQTHASNGQHLRKDMPVIHKHDILKFKKFLEDKGIKSKITKIEVGKFHPLQKQIYMNKSIDSIAEHGIQKTKQFLKDPKVITVISNDFYIIDGHHRMLSGMLVDPKMKFSSLQVDIPSNELLDLALDFSDQIGNIRNESMNEEWWQTYKINSLREPLDVYKNPSRKEIVELAKQDYDSFRAMLLDNGDMFAWSKAIHGQAHKSLKIDKGFIPVQIDFKGTVANVKVTDFINNSNWNDHREKVAGQIRKNRSLNKLFSGVNITYYNSQDWTK